jgi:hypothetical protein
MGSQLELEPCAHLARSTNDVGWPRCSKLLFARSLGGINTNSPRPLYLGHFASYHYLRRFSCSTGSCLSVLPAPVYSFSL